MGATSSTDAREGYKQLESKHEALRKRYLSKKTLESLEEQRKQGTNKGYRRNISERLAVREYEEDKNDN